MNIDVHEALSR